MKRILALLIALIIPLCVVCACAPDKLGGEVSQTESGADLNVSETEIIAAYEEYVKGIRPTQYEQYGFRDMNSDGIPELLVWLEFHLTIYTYKSGEVKEFYQPGHNAMNGPLTILEHNAIFIKHSSTGTFYTYTTFNKDGTAKEVCFYLCQWSENDIRYSFEDKSVTKEEWDKLTKEYFEYSEMPEARIEWKSIKQLQNSSSMEAYEDFVADLAKNGEEICYLIKDIDGDYAEELLINESKENKILISVYTYNGEVKLLDSKDASTGNVGTTRFLSSAKQAYSGIFLFGTGGGLNRYNYLTLADGKISIEKLWDEDFSDSFDDREKIVEYSKDKELIAESKVVFKAGEDINWLNYEYPEWSAELKKAYDDAMLKYKSDSEKYRRLGVPQSETQEIVEISGQYYQSYVSGSHDMRYILIKAEEYPSAVSWSWNWEPVGTAETYSLDQLGTIDEGYR